MVWLKTVTIPFSPFPFPVLLGISSHLKGIGSKISNMFPYLELELRQAEIDLSAEEYGSVMFFLFAFYFSVFSSIVYLFMLKLSPPNALIAALTFGGLFSLMVFVQLSVYPKIKVKRKVRDLDRNLIFALRTILIEIKSGVSLFDSIGLIAQGEFGSVSKEFRNALEKINSGTLEEAALEEIATYNPSLFFRRTIWQLVNGLKAGAEVSVVMKSLVETLSKEQRNQIRKYGSSLRLLSLMYMMLGIIVPALGLTFLIILGSFPQISIEEWMFWGLLVFVAIGQFMYLGILKTNRPSLLGG
ncbi:MAG: type II secretion system F family protein [Candidatus Diapherotrites archaeon]|uniref:Type II secretion system F family protein n=1 Tax=Candidatus Iainarchaeum sp. TaxID=3101447 RepID=A0A7J4IR24_9ARCH|nr:MAG: archaeal flagellar protein FlaJ [archaeon GW2011_AR10]MBS3059772.1 type II secretion system F family protein [Candidatus Diapherotrites archaeon]HIH07963.1 type II secretion system F family protein [Candidatus Diapherotrites archaeon]